MKEVNELLKRLGELDDAPMIWINKKVYENPREIERLKKRNENLEIMYQDIVTQAEWHDEELKEEIERLNNNINKLEKELEDMATLKTDKYGNTRKITHIDINWLLTKIKELKGVDKG